MTHAGTAGGLVRGAAIGRSIDQVAEPTAHDVNGAASGGRDDDASVGGEALRETFLPASGLPVIEFVPTSSLNRSSKGSSVFQLFASLAGTILLLGGLAFRFRENLGWSDSVAYYSTGLSVLGALVLFSVGRYKANSLNREHGGQAGVDGEARDLAEVSSYEDVATHNQRLISTYHILTTTQARSAYRNSQIAMGVGLAILAVGAIIVIQSASLAGQLVLGGLTALGGAFSAYLGATFIAAYNRAREQMNYYYGQPLVNSYLLNAERLAKDLSPESRDEALKDVIAKTLEGAVIASGTISPQDSAKSR